MSERFLDYIDLRLQQWAEWFSRENYYGIGYPSSSIEYRLIKDGIIYRNKYVNKPIECHSDAEEIEKLVKEMSVYDNKMSDALRCHYFHRGSLRDKAKQIKISHTQFKYYVDLAKQWLSGRLSIKKLNKKDCNVKTNIV